MNFRDMLTCIGPAGVFCDESPLKNGRPINNAVCTDGMVFVTRGASYTSSFDIDSGIPDLCEIKNGNVFRFIPTEAHIGADWIIVNDVNTF